MFRFYEATYCQMDFFELKGKGMSNTMQVLTYALHDRCGLCDVCGSQSEPCSSQLVVECTILNSQSTCYLLFYKSAKVAEK